MSAKNIIKLAEKFSKKYADSNSEQQTQANIKRAIEDFLAYNINQMRKNGTRVTLQLSRPSNLLTMNPIRLDKVTWERKNNQETNDYAVNTIPEFLNDFDTNKKYGPFEGNGPWYIGLP
jgi:hypothetical protein